MSEYNNNINNNTLKLENYNIQNNDNKNTLKENSDGIVKSINDLKDKVETICKTNISGDLLFRFNENVNTLQGLSRNTQSVGGAALQKPKINYEKIQGYISTNNELITQKTEEIKNLIKAEDNKISNLVTIAGEIKNSTDTNTENIKEIRQEVGTIKTETNKIEESNKQIKDEVNKIKLSIEPIKDSIETSKTEITAKIDQLNDETLAENTKLKVQKEA